MTSTVTTAAVLRADAVTETAAVVAPYGDGPYPRVFERHGWRTVAVVPERRLRPLAYQDVLVSHGCTSTLIHRGVRVTVKALRALGASAVLAGSAAGIDWAERIAWRLDLPGNDPATSLLRYDRGAQAGRLAREGIPALRGVRTSSLAEAVAFTKVCPMARYVLAPAVAGTPVEAVVCENELQISAAWSAMKRSAARYSSSAHLVLSEPHALCQYTVHTATRLRADGRPEHTVTDVWAQTRTAVGHLDRTDLLPADGLLTRALSRYTQRALDALGVVCGPVTCQLAYAMDEEAAGHGPLLISALAVPAATPADDALRVARGRDRVTEALDMWIPPFPALVHAAGEQHVVRVHLAPGTGITSWAERLLRALPTVVAVNQPRRPVGHGTLLPAEAVLSSSDPGAIERDYRVIRALERAAPVLRDPF